MKPLYLSLFFLLSFSPVFGQSDDQPSFSVQALQEDFMVFRGSLEDFHPGLYWYRTKPQIDSIFHQIQNSLTNPLSEREYFRILASVLSKIGCGHTGISLSEQTAKAISQFLPLKLAFIKGKAYFIEAYGNQPVDMQPGNQLLSINGEGMDVIYDRAMDMLSEDDGFAQSGKHRALNDYFWYIHAELFEPSEAYAIEFTNHRGEKESTIIPALARKPMYDAYFSSLATDQNPRNVILTTSENVATLVIKSFFGWKEGKKQVKFERKLQEVFETLQQDQITDLIIDLRDNGGGKVPWVFYSYFVDEPFLFANEADFIYSRISAYNSFQKLHPDMRFLKRKWLNTWLPGSNKMSQIDSSRYRLTGLFMTKPFQPSLPKFQGNVYLLIDGGTFSAASDFAAMMKSSGLATIIGEESGGGYYGNTSMEKSYVTLPNSKIRLEIPLVRHQLNVNASKNAFGRGVLPDHEVNDCLEDILEGNDPQMERAWSLIGKR